MVGDTDVVVYDVENDGQTSIVKGLDQFFELSDCRTVSWVTCVSGSGRHETDRHVAPMVFILGLRVEFENGLEFDCVDAQFAQVAVF